MATATTEPKPLLSDELRQDGRLLRARQLPFCRPDLSARQPSLESPSELKHIKPRLLGHWGTTPGQNFIYVHLNRVIKQHDLNTIYIPGPGTAARPWWPIPISRGPTARSIPTSRQTRAG